MTRTIPTLLTLALSIAASWWLWGVLTSPPASFADRTVSADSRGMAVVVCDIHELIRELPEVLGHGFGFPTFEPSPRWKPGERKRTVDALFDDLRSNVAPASWNSGNCILRELSANLIIRQTPENHRAVARRLRYLWWRREVTAFASRTSPLAVPLLLLAWLVQFIRRQHAIRQRFDRQLCVHCGYDLRATPTRCPECGGIPPSARPRLFPFPKRRPIPILPSTDQ